ncbi:MAG: carboxypeptidase regulatory-like domain-containing protein [Bryobacterales bacterium]|nr:carboxypeptidase regulatory-like domain-containing protein [Bryobacterales bacterium]
MTTSTLFAQVASGRIEGTIADPSGALIPNATVTVRDIKRETRTKTTSNTAGAFIFPSLQPSTYQLTVEAPGFSKQVVENIELNVSATVAQAIRLEVGAVTEQVVVSAEAVRINTSDAQIGRNITLKDIDTLPQLARNPMALAVFQPGVQIDPGDNTFSRVNGTRQGSNNTRLDGIDSNDAVVPRLGLSMTPINVDSVEEFRIITNGGKAEYGRSAGGQVEMITRSGTNKFHGSAFEYLRNTKLNANTFFSNSSGLARPKFIQNIFGSSFGGPLRKDKTFIFGNYQGRRTSQEVVRNRTVPTPELKSGIFRWRAPGSTEVQSVNVPALDPTRRGIDPFVKTNSLDLLPNPNNTDLGDGLNLAGFRFNNPAGGYEDQYTIRADHQLWSTNRIFGRWSWQRQSSIDALNNQDAAFPGRPQGSQGGKRWGYSIGSDWSITPTMINELRVGYRSSSVDFVRPDRTKGPAMITNSWEDPIRTAFAQGRNSPVIDLTENLTKVAGKHTFKAGYTRQRVLQYGYNEAGIYPNLNLARTFGNAPAATLGPNGAVISPADRQRFENLYNDLLGRVSSINQTFYSNLETWQAAGTPRIRNFVFVDQGFFFQDDWKVSRTLTLNLGLRWEMFGPGDERDSLQGSLDKVGGINTISQINNFAVTRQSQYYNRDWNDLAPRFGFAWDPTGSGKTAIRGSYGIFYDRIIGATTSSVDGNTPGFAQATTSFPNQTAGADNRISTLTPAMYPQQPAAPVLIPPANRNISVIVFGDNLRSGYMQQFSFNIQREVLRNTVLDVGFVRTRGTKLFTWLDMNQPRVFGDFLTSFRELAAFSANGTAPSAGNTLVRMFGTPAAAVTGVGGTAILRDGLLGTAADNVDRTNFGRFAPAGISDFYLRNYPQFNQLITGTNHGESWYNSLQVSFRRTAGALRIFSNYTFSKSVDTISVDGNGFTATVDNYNLNQFRGRSDADRPHSFNGSAIYALPLGRGKRFGGDMPRWADSVIGGWEVGALMVWQSGSTLTVSSQRRTGPSTSNTWANYSGDRNIGEIKRLGNGVTFWDPALASQFTFPAAGEFGTSGRNTFRGPRYFNTDLSIVKTFKLFDTHRVNFRAEMYNAFNNANFGAPGTNILNGATFGRVSAIVGMARVAQMALRYDF